MRISMGAFIPAAPFRQSRPGHRADRQRVQALLTDKHYPWGVYASTGQAWIVQWLTLWIAAMIIERLSREHRNIEKLLAILERELEIFDRADRPDYEVIRAVISYFEVYPEVYHHPQEDLVFAKLRTRDPVAAAKVGDLAREHHKGAERLRHVAHAVENILADSEILRQTVNTIIRDFIAHERR